MCGRVCTRPCEVNGCRRTLLDEAVGVDYIKRYLAEHNIAPKPFTWTKDADTIIAAVKRGHQALDSIH